jgi:hypothetical protein
MVFLSRAGFLTALLALPASAWADPPRLTGTSPLGVQRGKAVEVSFQGSGLVDGPRLVAPFGFRLEESAASGPEAANWKVRLTVDVRTAVGVYPVRIVTDSGVSNPILFAIGQLPQVLEVEPNNTFDRAQPIPMPVVVEGECTGNDEDFFRFTGHEGDRIVVDAVCARIGSGVDPMIRLTTADRRLVAAADDTPGLFTDGYLTTALPRDGEYVLEFCDSRFAGSGRAVYRLLVGAVPFAGEAYPLSLPRGQNTALELRGGTLSGDRLFALRTPSDPLLAMFYPAIPARSLGDPDWEDSTLDVELPAPVLLGTAAAVHEPADPAQKLPPLSPPVTILGRLSRAGERDEFTITAPPESKHEIRVESWGLGSALDGQLHVFDREDRSLGESDDGRVAAGRRTGGGGGRAQGPVSTDPTFDLTMPAGQSEVRLVVKDLVDRGGVGFTYRVVVTPVETGFQLAVDDDKVAIPRGGTALIPVTVTRTGYTGPIALDVLGVPAGGGVTVLPGTVPAGQAGGVVGLKAAAESPAEAREVQVVGKARDGQTVAASRTIVFAEQTISTPGFGMAGTIPSYTRPLVSLTSAVIKPGPILLNPEAPKLVVPQGCVVEVPIQVVRSTGAEKTYRLAALSAPTGLSVAESEIGETGTSATVKVTAAADAPLGPLTVGLVAQAPGQGGAPATRRGTGAANTRGPAPPPPPAVAATMIAVEVVRPASLELAASEIDLTPGGSVELRGKVTRVAPFAQEVEVKLDGLPVGVKAAPVKVATDASEFTFTLETAGDAVPVAALANAVLAFRLGDKDVAGASLGLSVKVLARK